MAKIQNKGRRNFLKLLPLGSFFGCASLLSKPALADGPDFKLSAPMPPGADSLKNFQKTCTACQLCVSLCPSKVLVPALFENGLLGFMQPVLKFDVHHFCEYECRKCIEACPTKALGQLSIEEKKLTRIGAVELIVEKCIVLTKNKSCGACAEHCPTGALRMVAHKPGLTKPEIVHKEACIGCGGCESICPERRVAIYVKPLGIHEAAAKPKIVKKKKIEVEGFGF